MRLRAKPDKDIDFSDAPLVLDWGNAEIGKLYRPQKEPVTTGKPDKHYCSGRGDFCR